MCVCMYVIFFSPADVAFSPSEAVDDLEACEESEISAMVNFLVANRNKIMQVCLEDDKSLQLDTFNMVLQRIIENDIRSALVGSTRITALILDILDVNKINT